MSNTLVVAGLCAELAVIFWVAQWGLAQQNRADRAEMALWADLSGTRGTPITLAGPEPLALGQITAPTQAELHLWLLATDGAPTCGRPGQGKPVPDLWAAVSAWGESVTAPGRRVLPAWWRYSTGELQAVVG